MFANKVNDSATVLTNYEILECQGLGFEDYSKPPIVHNTIWNL